MVLPSLWFHLGLLHLLLQLSLLFSHTLLPLFRHYIVVVAVTLGAAGEAAAETAVVPPLVAAAVSSLAFVLLPWAALGRTKLIVCLP